MSERFPSKADQLRELRSSNHTGSLGLSCEQWSTSSCSIFHNPRRMYLRPTSYS
jgi:hypothetical protein